MLAWSQLWLRLIFAQHYTRVEDVWPDFACGIFSQEQLAVFDTKSASMICLQFDPACPRAR
jgi:hypothetical protein